MTDKDSIFYKLGMRAIDDLARDGQCRLLSDGDQYAVGRWTGEHWVFPAASGARIDFEPLGYKP